MTREERVAAAQATILALLDNKQKSLLNSYIEIGVEELDRKKPSIYLQTNIIQYKTQKRHLVMCLISVSYLWSSRSICMKRRWLNK